MKRIKEALAFVATLVTFVLVVSVLWIFGLCLKISGKI